MTCARTMKALCRGPQAAIIIRRLLPLRRSRKWVKAVVGGWSECIKNSSRQATMGVVMQGCLALAAA